MKRQYRLMLRTLCCMLSLCFVAIAAAPMAYATTPAQEAALLATDQRSINNPQGSFEVPGALPRYRLLYPNTLAAMRLALQNFLQQLFFGSGEAESFRRILAYTPIVKEDAELPEDEVTSLADLDINALRLLLDKGLRDICFVFKETQEPGVYRIVGILTARSDEKYWMSSGMIYDANTGIMASENGTGILGTGYEYGVDQQMLRTAPNGWNGLLGFNRLYDMLTPLIFFFLETQRIQFSYQGKDWMIQIWKGFYTMSNGAEIGIYEKPAGRPFHWDASDTMLDMSMKVYQGEQLYLDFGTQHTWWAGGFSYASPIYKQVAPKRIRLTGTITFEDPGMRDAFWESFQALKNDLMTGTMDGMVFSFDWAAAR